MDVGVPTEAGRLEILTIKTKKVRLAADVNLAAIAADAHGFVGSDCAQLCLEAALAAVREQLGAVDIDAEHLDPELLVSEGGK